MRIYTFAGTLLIVVIALWIGLSPSLPACQQITLASTTSVENSGLYDYILPQFSNDSGIEVRVIAVGTGQALSIARKGDADLLIVHDKESELEFMRQDYGIERRVFMYNDYILVGPAADPIEISDANNLVEALQKIADTKQTFISRGDNSGTHKKELSLWKIADLEIGSDDSWYLEVGRGMGGTLNMANQLGAYTLSDRSTWISFNNRDKLKLLVENNPALINPYSVVLVNPAKHPSICYEEAQTFVDWLTTPRGLALIRSFRVKDTQLFFTY